MYLYDITFTGAEWGSKGILWSVRCGGGMNLMIVGSSKRDSNWRSCCVSGLKWVVVGGTKGPLSWVSIGLTIDPKDRNWVAWPSCIASEILTVPLKFLIYHSNTLPDSSIIYLNDILKFWIVLEAYTYYFLPLIIINHQREIILSPCITTVHNEISLLQLYHDPE